MKNIFTLLLIFISTELAFSQRKSKKKEPVKIASVEPAATPAAERWAGYKIRKELADKSIVKDIKFRSVGPTAMSGRVADIDVNNAKPTEFYVAYATGGLWKTVNNGQSFTPLFDNEAVITLGDIAVDWNSKNRTIWAGTGESISSRSSYAGIGIYKSDDDGKTWQHKGLDETHHIGEIKIHPN